MSSIKRAREALLSGDGEGALLRLQSETGFEAGIVAFGLTVDGFVDKAINGALEDVQIGSVPANTVELVKDELWKGLSKRYADWEPESLRALGLHISGVSAVDASRQLKVEAKSLQLMSARRGFLAERKWVLGQISGLVGDFAVVDVKVEAQLRPIVKRLGRKALEGLESDELTAKEALKAFTELGRLLAQVTGELVEKKHIEIGPTEQFMAIMEAAERMPVGLIECTEYELVE